jgi:hypothetical protein
MIVSIMDFPIIQTQNKGVKRRISYAGLTHSKNTTLENLNIINETYAQKEISIFYALLTIANSQQTP